MPLCSRLLLVMATLTITCLVLSHQLPVDCNKPLEHMQGEIIDMYIQCVKSLTSDQRYGKRSSPNHSTFLKKLHPRLFQNFAYQPSQNLQNLQDFYQLFKQDNN
ncbi:uncharacterized protein [Leptinotarsa decemlineata]|uniref:uncharacterized protein n=1 Tax=Leptinotarsa decemlineata TaxID=7539 RepID=UPI003D3047FE